jgi:TolB-like protein/Flp pilus assembly protein TadD
VRIKLHEQPFQILLLMLERPGEVVTREEICRCLWTEQTFVDFAHGVNTAIMKLRRALGERADKPVYIETIPRRGYRFIAPVSGFPASSLSFRSIAVLPLENFSSDLEQDYFADGMTDELITQLAQVGPLRVISRTSVMQYKRVRKPLSQVARELQVQAVVEGSVQRAGDRIRITAQLLDAVNDRHLWAATYDRDLREVLVLQREVAAAIVEAIRVRVIHPAEKPSPAPKPVNPEAYDAYSKACFFFSQRSAKAYQRAREHFLVAIDKDPECAPAHARLSITYRVLNLFELLAPQAAYVSAKAAAETAIRLEPGMSEGHAALAAIKAYYEWDWAGSEKEFQIALGFNPNSVTARVSYSTSLASMGRLADALEQNRMALWVDPHSFLVRTLRARILYLARRYDPAYEELREILDMNADLPSAWHDFGLVCIQKGMLERALHSFRKSFELERQPRPLAAVGYASGLLGDVEEATRIVHELSLLTAKRYVAPTSLAFAYLGLQDNGSALQWLERAADERESTLPSILWDPVCDVLRQGPRFVELMRRTGLNAVTAQADRRH